MARHTCFNHQLSNPRTVNRRQMLECLGALAATAACSGNEADAGNAPGTAGTGNAVAGANSGVAGTGGSAQPASAGAGGTGSAGKGGSTTVGNGGQATGGSTGGTANASSASGTGGTPAQAGTGSGGQPGGAGGQSAGAPNTAGGGAGGATAGGPTAGGAAGAAGGGGGTLTAPSFDDVPMCTASKTDSAGQGPFFIHDLEKADDISLIRQDIRGRYNESAEPGVEMQLHLRILDSTSSDCNGKPVAGVQVYIWHTDAQGFYSGFGTRGGDDEQNPDNPYSGTPGSNNLENTDRFLRGVQTTDADGVVSFRSIFPGWYNGRDLHIHFVAFKPDSTSAGRVNYTAANSSGKWLFTTQFYFQPDFSKSIHEKNQPYLRRTTLSAYAGAMAADESGNSGLRCKASLSGDTDGVGGIVTAQMQIVLDPKA